MNPRNFGAEGFLPKHVTESFTSVGKVELAQMAVGEDATEKVAPPQAPVSHYDDLEIV